MSDNVDPLSGAYHRARQGYGIITGVLLLWVYVGVTMQAIPIVNVELNTPNAVPHVLALLLGYYLIRFTLEWYQCDKQRRCEIASRVDFAFAHGLGVFALGSYFLRHFLDVPVGGTAERERRDRRASRVPHYAWRMRNLSVCPRRPNRQATVDLLCRLGGCTR